MVRFQLAFSLGEAAGLDGVIPALASIAIKDANSKWTCAAVASSISGRSLMLLGALSQQRGFLTSPDGQRWIDELAYLAGSEREPGPAREFLNRLNTSKLGSRPMMSAVLALARGRQRAGGSVHELLEGKTSDLMASLLAESARIAESHDREQERVTAIRLLGLADAKTARRVFPTLLDARQPIAVQLAVLQGLASVFDHNLAREIITRWKSMSPSVRREAVEVLFGRRDGIEAMISALESGALISSELDPARLEQLRAHSDPSLRARARKVLAAYPAALRDRNQVIAAYRPAIQLVGNRDKGRDVFIKVCATCHQAEGRGVDVGPSLATVAGRSPEDLLMHILDPNREVAPNFLAYNVALEDGRVVSGIIAEESAAAMTLKRAEGVSDSIPRDQIETIRSTGISLMPEGLEKGLSPQDFANLIAFVRSIGPPAPSAAGPAAAIAK